MFVLKNGLQYGRSFVSQKTSVLDPYLFFNAGPDQVLDPGPGIGSKIAISIGLHKGRPNNRKCLQPSKRTSSISKEYVSSLMFLFLCVIFAHLDPDLANQINADLCGS
jgi:hypothetical protein